MSGEVASSRANTLGLRAGAPAAGTLSNVNGTDSLQSMLHALDERTHIYPTCSGSARRSLTRCAYCATGTAH